MNKFSTSELSVLVAYLSSLAKSLNHYSGAETKDNGPPLSADTPTLWWECWVMAVALLFFGLTFLKSNLYSMSKLGWQRTTGALVVLAWCRASSHEQGLAGYILLEFSIYNVELEGKEKCWKLSPCREILQPWWKLGDRELHLPGHTQPEQSFHPAELGGKERVMTQVPQTLAVVTEI